MNVRVSSLARKLGKDNLLVTSCADTFYLTGIRTGGFWLLVSNGKVYAFAPRLLGLQLRSGLKSVNVIESDDLAGSLAGFMKKYRNKELLVNTAEISHNLFAKLSETVKVKGAQDFVEEARSIKDSSEQESIIKASKITSAALSFARKHLKPGVSEIEIVFKIEEYFAKNNSRPAFETIVAFGANSAFPHHVSSKTKLKKDDTALIDLGCSWNGYCSDLTRTFFFGKISENQHRVCDLVKKAHDLAIQSVKSGAKAFDVDKTARQIISLGGYGRQFVHSTGHGVGVDIHEAPRISAKDKTVLKPGMVVTVEPGIYIQGCFGVRIEDTVLVTKKGCEVLTK